MRTWIALLTASLAGCTAADAASTSAPRAAPATLPAVPASATPLPRVALAGLEGGEAWLDKTAAGKPALVTFWATWCEACAAEIGALNRLHDRAAASGAVVIGVNVGEGRDKASPWAREHGIRYPQLLDERMALADALGQKRLPATIVLDRQGRVVFTGGALDEKALAAFRGVMER